MPNKRLLLAVFLISLSLFMFEITLTRLFSAIMFYHFVFLAISLAILSLGLGGIAVYRIRNLDLKQFGFTKENILKQSSLLFALTSILVIVIIYKTPYFQLAFFVYLFISSLPFILGGMFLSEAFYQYSRQSLFLYFADLVGSGLGSILIINLLDNYSIITTVIFIALIALLAHLLMGKDKASLLKILATSLLIIALSIFGQSLDNMAADFTAYFGNAKAMGLLKGNPRSIFTTWNSFARTDVIETDDRKEKIVLVDGSTASKMIPFDGDLKKIAFLKKEIGYLPFKLGSNSKVLLIGPGGGMDLLLARLAGIQDITAVEINKGTIEAAKKFADFNGNIYFLPGTKTLVQDGRSFISNDNNTYDVIYLSMVMTQAAETLGYALSENYIYTLEAFTEYLNHLKPNGKLALVLHGESDLKKAVSTALKTLEKRGLTRDEAVRSIAYLSSYNDNEGHHSKIYYPLLIIKDKPFSEKEAKELQELAALNQQEILHLPFIQSDTSLTKKDTNINKWVVTDNSPFFYNSQGKSIPLTIWIVFGTVYLVGRRALKPHYQLLTSTENKPLYYYFILLGLGFMLIEIPLIQKFVLFIGHPTLTFSVVIATLLTSGGIGSLLAGLTKNVSPSFTAGFITLYSLVISTLLPKIFAFWQGDPIQTKIVITILVLLPLGLALGIPFPSGMLILKEKESSKQLIPLMWGVNGWTSVLGSIMALMIAMVLGYNWALITGALIYALFVFNYNSFTKSSKFSNN
jgi:spermidine synthase